MKKPYTALHAVGDLARIATKIQMDSLKGRSDKMDERIRELALNIVALLETGETITEIHLPIRWPI